MADDLRRLSTAEDVVASRGGVVEPHEQRHQEHGDDDDRTEHRRRLQADAVAPIGAASRRDHVSAPDTPPTVRAVDVPDMVLLPPGRMSSGRLMRTVTVTLSPETAME